ncbi:DOC family protein [Aspergillus varians]
MATKTFRFLTSPQIQRLHAKFIIPNVTPTQLSMLESATNSPMNMKHYGQVDDDGNKRTALVAADMFLKINGYYLQKVPFADDTQNRGLANAHVAFVTNRWTTEQLGKYYRSIAAPLDQMSPKIMEFKNAATEY